MHPTSFLSNTVSTKTVGMHFVLSIVLMLLLATVTILVCVLFAPPYLLTLSLEMIFILVLLYYEARA